MVKRVHIATLGCKVNQADSAEIASCMTAQGYKSASAGEPADICIVNTCTVTARADFGCRQMIRRLRRKNPAAKIVVTGCYANVAAERLKEMKEVDEVVLNVIASASEQSPQTGSGPLLLMPMNSMTSSGVAMKGPDPFSAAGLAMTARTRPQLKIQDGCNNFCAYCIVPYARGRSRSMAPDEVVDRVKKFASAGYHEVVLVGIHLGHYGLDLTPRTNLTELLKELTSDERRATSDALRIRLSSIDPEDWAEGLIDFVASSRNICHHFHIPLQSGDDEILKGMGRRYTTGDYRRLVTRLKSVVPDAGIGTDVIVGFPGETIEHFNTTRAFIESLPLSYLHVFPYSVRPMTSASHLPETVTTAEKRRRVAILREVSAVKRREFYKSMIGREADVVIENKPKSGRLKGITGNYIPVLIDGGVELAGRLCRVRIRGHTLNSDAYLAELL